MIKLGSLKAIQDPIPDDLLIVCASFEEKRCRESVQRARDYLVRCPIIVNSRSISGRSGSKGQERSALFLIEKLQDLGLHRIPRLISVDPYDYFGLWYSITDELSRHGLSWGDRTATIDMSCLTKVQLIFLLKEIILTQALKRCRLVYTVPEYYNREKGDKFSWLAVGYFDPFVFPVRAERRTSTNRRRAALIVLGHEGQRTLTAWRYIDPDETILIFAETDNERMMEICRRENEFLISRVGGEGSNNVVRVNLLDITGVRDQVIGILDRISDRKNVTISIVPFGPKPIVVGILLAILQARQADVELVYPVPRAYNANYSRGAKEVYAFDLL